MNTNHILIADDEPGIVAQLRDGFTQNGYRTICTCNGLEAWDELARRHPDEIAACVVDLQMPPGSLGGKDLVAKIRRAFSKRVPIVIYSGHGTISSSHEVTRAGADAFIEKEAGMQALVDTVTKLIAENTRPIDPTPSSMNELARSSDLPSLTLRAIRDLETLIRATILTNYTPSNLHALFTQKKNKPPAHVMERLSTIADFAHDAKLSLGDILDILAALSAAQVQQLPPASEIRSHIQQIVPVRNALFHGRAVENRELIIAIMSADDLLAKLRKPR